VFNYILRLVGDRVLAEDLTQEVFLRVFQGLPKFSLRCRFTTWLFQVAKNRVLDELRANERRPRSFLALDDLPPLEVLDAPLEQSETIDAVWRAVNELTVDLKMALLLRDVTGLSYTEIADSLRAFVDKGRLERAARIPDSDVEISDEGEEVRARVKDYKVIVDFARKTILHDCEDWSSRLVKREFCKHVGKVFLRMESGRAVERLDRIRGERKLWRFEVPSDS